MVKQRNQRREKHLQHLSLAFGDHAPHPSFECLQSADLLLEGLGTAGGALPGTLISRLQALSAAVSSFWCLILASCLLARVFCGEKFYGLSARARVNPSIKESLCDALAGGGNGRVLGVPLHSD